jgi:hypothetical protein
MRYPAILILAATAAAIVAPHAGAGEEVKLELQSGPYVLAPLKDGATVCWQTEAAVPATLRYRAKEASDWREVKRKAACFQTVRLTGLQPGTDYEVKVLSGGRELGGLKFRTVPEKLTGFTFFVYGDTRSNPDQHELVAAALAAHAAKLKQPTFTLMTGDLAISGSDEAGTAREFFIPAKPLLEMMPLAPLRGNHECATDLFPKYFPAPTRPAEAEGADDYVLDYGSVRVVVLDQYGSARTGGPRMEWLAARLSEAENQWRIVAFHEPIYSSGAHGENQDWKALVDPILRKHRVHAVFCGHNHNYERSKPRGGVTHFTSGGGGAPLRDTAGGLKEYSVKFEAVLHFISVRVTPEKLTVTAHRPADTEGRFEVFDTVEIPRECAWASTGETKKVLYGLKPNPWKRWTLYGGIALLLIALVAKAVQLKLRAKKNSAGAA